VRRRLLPVIAVVAAVAAVGLAIAAWYRGRDGGAAVASAAATDWPEAMARTRACLLGSPPQSEDVVEAIAAIDLATQKRTCSHVLIDLSAAAGNGPAWGPVRRAIGDLADAYTNHPGVLDAGDDPLPGAIGRLEVAAAALRPQDPRPKAPRAAIDPLVATPLVIDGDPAVYTGAWRNVLFTHTLSSEAPYEVRWIAGTMMPLPLPTDGSDAVWSPAGTWQVWIDDAGSRHSKVMMATDTGADVTLIAEGPAGQQVVAAIGEDTNRLVVYRDDRGGWLARSVNDGRTWSRVRLPIPAAYITAAVSPAGDRLDLVWWDVATRRLSLEPARNATGTLPPFTTLTEDEVWSQCLRDAMWLVVKTGDEYTVQRADTGGITARFKTEPLVAACAAERAMISVDGHDLSCDSTACKPLPVVDRYTTDAIVGGEVVREAHDHDVMAVWWGDKPPVFTRLPHGRQLRAVIDNGGRAVAIFTTEDDRVEVADLPH